MKILIQTFGFFGDILFASSVAKKLKEEGKADQVDYLIGFPQVKPLLDNNPHIDNVFVSQRPGSIPVHDRLDRNFYDNVIQLGEISLLLPPATEYQMLCGVEDTSSEFEVYTNEEHDKLVQKEFEEIRSQLTDGAKILYIPMNWGAKAYVFTEQQYKSGRYQRPRDAEIPYRDCDKITKSLGLQHYVILGGLPHGIGQQSQDSLQKSLELEAAVIKHCDWYVGPEGGLGNIAGGVGTKTIITTDFVQHLYGPMGIIKPTSNPQLGPKKMFPNTDHYELSPYLSDEEVFNEIQKIIMNYKNVSKNKS